MDKVTRIIRNEPARVIALVIAVLQLVAVFGLHVTDDQSAAIVSVVSILVGGELVRSKVTPVDRD